MVLTVLSDDDVREVLDSLTREDVLEMHKTLRDALHSYSTSTDASDNCCSENQPTRIAIKRKDGSNTLFMPAMGDTASGVKIIHVDPPTLANETALPYRENSITSSDSSTRAASFSSASRTSSKTSMSTSNSNSKTDSTYPPILEPGTRLNRSTPSDTNIRGSLTLLTPTGQPRALINASQLTAFRTALASSLLLRMRQTCHDVTVFGAGLQAYWHIHLTLLLRGSEVHHINVINRDFGRAQRLMMQLAQCENEAISDCMMARGQKLRPTILTPVHGEYDRLLKEHVRSADVIYCCTPATQPLFPPGHLTHTEGRRKARYIAAIGSYKPHMQELHEDVLIQAVKGPEETKHNHGLLHMHHRHASEGGAVIVDTIEGAMKESGEIIKAGIGGHGIVELGELVMLKRSHWAEKAERERADREHHEQESRKSSSDASSKSSNEKKNHGHGLGHLFHKHVGKESHDKASDHEIPSSNSHAAGDGGLMDWLSRGNVIYKSVGLGLMDIVVGMDLVRLAEERGIGTTIESF